jgi:glucose/mannose transport system permease protein
VKNIRRWGPGLLLVSPSIILITIFVYGLIGWNIKVSLSNWRQAQPSSHYAGLGAYRDLNHDAAFRQSLAHLLVFTVVFALGTLIIGWTLALLLDKGVKGEGFFRADLFHRRRNRLALVDEPGAW